MINSIKEYLSVLKQKLAGSDRATVQDALSDAEEYLRNALENARKGKTVINESEVLSKIMQSYGSPEEVAMAYRQMETHPVRMKLDDRDDRVWWQRFFGIAGDSRAWSSLLFMFFSLVTGIFYFTWAVTGLSLSAGLLVLVIGLPFAGVFLLSIRGLALMEGRLVEALLGVRMPRRPMFSDKSLSLWGRLKALVSDRLTWTAMLYMVIMLPLGVIYFSLAVSLVAISLWLIARPVLELALGLPAFTFYDPYYTPGWLMPISVIAGLLIGILSLHLFKLIGKMQGNLAKSMLVRE